jgi:hypothetical protein
LGANRNNLRGRFFLWRGAVYTGKDGSDSERRFPIFAGLTTEAAS